MGEMMAERGVTLSYETVREWCLKSGGACAKRMRSRRSCPGDRWHLDKVFLKIAAKLQYLWRAVAHDGEVLDIVAQPRWDKHAAKRFFRTLLKALKYVPRAIITDKLSSYAAAKKQLLPWVEHRRDRWLDNSVQNSHESNGERERRTRGFKSPRHAQRFLSAFRVIASFFCPGRRLLSCGALSRDHASALHPVPRSCLPAASDLIEIALHQRQSGPRVGFFYSYWC